MTERDRGSRVNPEVEGAEDEGKEIEIKLSHEHPSNPGRTGAGYPLPHELGRGARRPQPHERLRE